MIGIIRGVSVPATLKFCCLFQNVLVAILLASLLTACAAPVRIDATPEVLSSVHSIAVIRPPEVKTLTVRQFGQPAAFWFGAAFGGLIGDAQDSAKGRQLTETLNRQNFVISSTLADDIAARLLQKGFEAKVEDAEWDESENKFNLPFEKIHSNADAVLVVMPTMVGFIDPGFFSSKYIPTINAEVTLLGKDRKQVLYRGLHASGWKPGANWKYTPEKVTFANFDSIMAHPSDAAASLREAASAIASTIAADIRP